MMMRVVSLAEKILFLGGCFFIKTKCFGLYYWGFVAFSSGDKTSLCKPVLIFWRFFSFSRHYLTTYLFTPVISRNFLCFKEVSY